MKKVYSYSFLDLSFSVHPEYFPELKKYKKLFLNDRFKYIAGEKPVPNNLIL